VVSCTLSKQVAQRSGRLPAQEATLCILMVMMMMMDDEMVGVPNQDSSFFLLCHGPSFLFHDGWPDQGHPAVPAFLKVSLAEVCNLRKRNTMYAVKPLPTSKKEKETHWSEELWVSFTRE